MSNTVSISAWLGLSLCFALGCSDRRQEATNAPGEGEGKSAAAAAAPGAVTIDGSSTVFPISEAVAEEFQKGNKARVTIGVSGTGGGFKKFCHGEVAVTGASRPIKSVEVELCKEANIEYIELPVAYDGIAVVTHKDSGFMDPIKVEELKKIWEPEAQGKVKRWNQIRSDWPDQEILLFGPGVDSGTYDYFTQAIVGTEHSSRGDFTSSEDDNVLVQGVATAPGSLGFFGFAYYEENKDKLHLIGVDAGKGPIKPSQQTVADGSYNPLSRPIFIYVSKKAAGRPEVTDFVNFYLSEGKALVKETGYIPLPDKAYELASKRFKEGTVGTMFRDGTKVGVTVEALLAGE